MAVYNSVIITEAGLQLLRNAALSEYALTAAQGVTSATMLQSPQEADYIPDIKQIFDYSLLPSGNKEFTLEAQLFNHGVTEEYPLNTVGFYANDGANADVLFAIITAVSPDTMPPQTAYPVNINFVAIITITNEGTANIVANFAGFATKLFVQNSIHNHNISPFGRETHPEYWERISNLESAFAGQGATSFFYDFATAMPVENQGDALSLSGIPLPIHLKQGVWNEADSRIEF